MSILKIQEDSRIQIIGSERSNDIGGEDFEKELRDYIINEIEKSKLYDLNFNNRKDIKWVRTFEK
jgi:molecular chaperone DnaK (HSP70)